jgi:hypothetical protein
VFRYDVVAIYRVPVIAIAAGGSLILARAAGRSWPPRRVDF